jgi:hypothetical protein
VELDTVILKVVSFICSNSAKAVDEFVLETLLKVDRTAVARVLGALIADGYLSEVSTGSSTCSSCPLNKLCSMGTRIRGSVRVFSPTEKLEKLCKSLVWKT